MYHKNSVANIVNIKMANANPIALTKNIGSKSFLASLVVLYGGLTLSEFKLSISFFFQQIRNELRFYTSLAVVYHSCEFSQIMAIIFDAMQMNP